MEEHNKTIHVLESHRASLAQEKKDILWKAIESDLAQTPVASPFLFNFVTQKSMAPIALALVLMLGLGGTAFASNEARPGDLLFPVDQTLEEVRLALARNDTDRAQLQIRFAEERLAELRSILNEDSDRNSGSVVANATSTMSSFEAEADVFTNTTIVKVEINDRTTTFETSADTRAEVVDEIVRRYAVAKAIVEASLDFEIEDRASRAQDVSHSDDARVKAALELLDKSVSTLSDDSTDRNRIIEELLLELYGEDSRVRIDDDRVEIRDGNQRIEVREKDGETEIRIKSDDDSDDDNDFDDDSNDRNQNSSSFEAEADVFTNTTIVKVEINDRTTTFETSADTRAEVVDEIVRRYAVAKAIVEASLDFEIEDRASRADDSDDDDNDDNNDDNSDSDDDNSVSDDSSDDSDGRVKVEVKVEDGLAEVRLEYDGKRDEFEMVFTTETALIAQLSARSGLSSSVISSNLDLEIKD